METGRCCRIPEHTAPLPRLPAPRCFPVGCGRASGSTLPRPPGIQYSHSASFLRRRLREGAERLLPSLTLGGDSLGTEEHITYLSCSWCFLSNPSASHSNPFISSSRMLAPRQGSLLGPAGRDHFLKGPPDAMPRTVQTFSRTSPPCLAQWTGGFSSLPGVFHTHSCHSLAFTRPDYTPSPPGCCSAPFLSSPFHLSPSWRLGWAERACNI